MEQPLRQCAAGISCHLFDELAMRPQAVIYGRLTGTTKIEQSDSMSLREWHQQLRCGSTTAMHRIQPWSERKQKQ